MKRILFVNHANRRCGVYLHGAYVFSIVKKVTTFSFDYAEVDSVELLDQKIDSCKPDIILYNYHESTLPFIDSNFFKRYRRCLHIGLMHKLNQQEADALQDGFFDYYIMGDPTLIERNPRVFKIGQIIPSYENKKPLPKIPTIGSFGFGTFSKGYENLITLVKNEFDQAVIRLNIIPSSYCDQDNLEKFKEEQFAKLSGTKIDLQISSHFFDEPQLLDFLADNTINVFLYPTSSKVVTDSNGISSAVNKALAVKRPIAVSESPMFRHLHSITPSIVIPEIEVKPWFFSNFFSKPKAEVRTLKKIIDAGIDHLSHLHSLFTEDAFQKNFEQILRKIESKRDEIVYGNRKWNRILDDEARAEYQDAIQSLSVLSPEMIQRKIPRANVQQAFIFDTVIRFATPKDRILCVGSYEDTAADSLKKVGYPLTEIDPQINYDLEGFIKISGDKRNSFDVIFSTSVLEHVENDELFIRRIVELLKPGGKAFLTFDFKSEYKKGDKIFDCNYRFYNCNDLFARILPLLKGCILLGTAEWFPARQDFMLDNINYCFATLSFEKLL